MYVEPPVAVHCSLPTAHAHTRVRQACRIAATCSQAAVAAQWQPHGRHCQAADPGEKHGARDVSDSCHSAFNTGYFYSNLLKNAGLPIQSSALEKARSSSPVLLQQRQRFRLQGHA